MKKVYRIVAADGTKQYDNFSAVADNYEITAILRNDYSRAELQGEPHLRGFVGPMYDGEQDGAPVVRYETYDIYLSMSI